MWAKLLPSLLSALAKLAGYLFAYKSGKDTVRADLAEDGLERAKNRNRIDADVSRMSDADLDKRVYGGK